MGRTAAVVGVTGIAGYNTAQALVAAGWRVIGLSRTPRYEIPGVEHVPADVLAPASVEQALAGRRSPTCSSPPGAPGHRGRELPGQRRHAGQHAEALRRPTSSTRCSSPD